MKTTHEIMVKTAVQYPVCVTFQFPAKVCPNCDQMVRKEIASYFTTEQALLNYTLALEREYPNIAKNIVMTVWYCPTPPQFVC